MLTFGLPFFSRPLWNLIAVVLIAAVIAYFFHRRRQRQEMERWEREEQG
jgi:preprotein translocase subunit YajC